MAVHIRRREFVVTLGGAAVAWSLTARSQERRARIGALMVIGETDPEAKDFVEPFETQLNAAGWRKGLNLEITYRWGASNPERLHLYAKELVDSAPDILLAFGTAALIPLHKATTTIPIVFVAVSDPVGQGFVASVRRPGSNITGFSNFDPDIGSKWLQLLKDIAPSVTNVTAMFNPNTSPYNALSMRSIETAAPGFGMSSVQASIQDEEDIRKTISLLAMKPGGGLIVPSDSFTYERSTLIASVAADNRLPAIYAFARFAHAGGLIAYGVNMAEQFGKAAGYVDRILKGAKAGELPVQAPTRYTMTINLKTASVLGLTVPLSMQMTADEVIE